MYLYSINLVIVLNYFIASSDTNDLRRKKASENPKAALHGPQRARLAKRRVRHRKILIEKIEIGPIYAPYKGKRERHDNKTTRKRRRSSGTNKKNLRKRSVRKTRRRREHQEDPSEAKRREDPPKTRAPRRTF